MYRDVPYDVMVVEVYPVSSVIMSLGFSANLQIDDCLTRVDETSFSR